MSRLLGFLFVLVIVLLAMAFAAANVGHRVTLNLGLFTIYRAPVTLVAFLGLLTGMLVMFAAGIHTDLKVRRILRERLAEETRKEQGWIDRNQRDLFAQDPEPEPAPRQSRGSVPSPEPRSASLREIDPEAEPMGRIPTEPSAPLEPDDAPPATPPSREGSGTVEPPPTSPPQQVEATEPPPDVSDEEEGLIR